MPTQRARLSNAKKDSSGVEDELPFTAKRQTLNQVIANIIVHRFG